MERRKVNRHVRPKRRRDPLGQLFEFPFRIIFSRNEQHGDLEPDVRVMLEIDQGL